MDRVILKNIDPILSGDLLLLLDQMGHGDELVVADRNFPAHAKGIPVVRAREGGVAAVIAAILKVFPLDPYVDKPLERMGVVDGSVPPNSTHQDVLSAAHEAGYADLEFGVVDRFEFYSRAAAAFAIVETLETAPYCDFILTKGPV